MNRGPGRTSPGNEAARRAAWTAVAGATVAWLGFHWDITWHTMFGRERFLLPPHVVIIVGLSIALFSSHTRARREGRTVWVSALRRSGSLIVLVASIGTFVALAFDNWWHELFGLDVTLWSPPHLLLTLGFLLILFGAILDLAQLGASPATLAVLIGELFAAATLLVFEFELGFLHYGMRWEAVALGVFTGSMLALTTRGTGLRWAGTLAGVSALGFRVVGVGFNALVGVGLPRPPVGIVAAGVAMDLVRAALLQRDVNDRLTTAASIAVAWVPMFALTGLARLVIGRTWWPGALVVPMAVLGLAGTFAGIVIGWRLGGFVAHARSRSEDDGQGVPSNIGELVRQCARAPRILRSLTAGVVAATLIGLTGFAVLGEAPGQIRPAVLERVGDEMRLEVEGGSADDWVSILGVRADRPEAMQWLGALSWDGVGFSGPLPPGDLIIMGVWFNDDDRAWTTFGPPIVPAEFILEKDAFRPPGGVDPFHLLVSYALLTALTVIPILLLGVTGAWLEASTDGREPEPLRQRRDRRARIISGALTGDDRSGE